MNRQQQQMLQKKLLVPRNFKHLGKKIALAYHQNYLIFLSATFSLFFERRIPDNEVFSLAIEIIFYISIIALVIIETHTL